MAKSKLVHKGQTVQVETFESPPRTTNTAYQQAMSEGKKAARDNAALAAKMDAAHQARKNWDPRLAGKKG